MNRVTAILLTVLMMALLGCARQKEEAGIERQALIAYDLGTLEDAYIAIDVVSLPAGQAVDKHKHTNYHEFVWIMEGKLTVNEFPAEGTEPTIKYLKKGDTDIAPINTVHSGTTDEGVKVLVVKIFVATESDP